MFKRFRSRNKSQKIFFWPVFSEMAVCQGLLAKWQND
jgi:hypothetical protein